MKTVHVFVNELDIATAVPQDSQCCPIALACQRADIFEASYDLDNLTFMVGDEEVAVYLGTTCETFARSFDRGDTVKPFDFVIEVPEPNDLVMDVEEEDREDQP